MPALAHILGDWVRSTGWMPVLHSREDDRAFIARLIAGNCVLVARSEAGGAPLGFIAVRLCDIVALHVADGHRGRGLGKALLDAAKAREPRLVLWTFQANSAAIAFYLREGFVEIERTDGAGNEEGLPDVRMIWRCKA
ncbi:MAG: GNAT family N-acetyltransferase [Rhodobacteraceae bacterium]|jgi:GNAT superfamily N-acetyltransferase|nr:GNAT family N-acetyltransferase [Paracoccaceae bacterium]